MSRGSGPQRPVILYYVPPSFYSQVARLGLEEKGVSYEGIVVAPGPPSFETYEPWYMRLNPMGTVPTLLVEGETIDDSRRILNATEDRFEGLRLVPSDQDGRAKVEFWVEEAYQVPERVLAYGSGHLKALGSKVNRGRLKALRKWRARLPEMAAVYDQKIADIEGFMGEAADADGVDAAWRATREKLDRLNGELAGNEFCCGDAYTLADVVWTVTVARQLLLGMDPFDGRPALLGWFERMRARPSFKRADVWTRFKPEVMLPVLLSKFKWQVLAATVVVTLLAAAMFRL